MNCGFQYVDLQVKHLVILRSIEFSTKILEDFLNALVICDLQIMVVQTRRSFRVGFQSFVAVPATP